mmetsp:Transcript_45620/g.145582  ORF Transcript_45620/g.145582 Transcript_45620/m.145582 type:complete len:204 (-) Transcript_45620:1346-1957(-)
MPSERSRKAEAARGESPSQTSTTRSNTSGSDSWNCRRYIEAPGLVQCELKSTSLRSESRAQSWGVVRPGWTSMMDWQMRWEICPEAGEPSRQKAMACRMEDRESVSPAISASSCCRSSGVSSAEPTPPPAPRRRPIVAPEPCAPNGWATSKWGKDSAGGSSDARSLCWQGGGCQRGPFSKIWKGSVRHCSSESPCEYEKTRQR